MVGVKISICYAFSELPVSVLAAGRRRPTESASVVRSSFFVALLLLLLLLLLFQHSDILGADGASNYHNHYQYSNSSPFSSPHGFPAFDPYRVLGLSPSANSKSIKFAYRKRALETHPDKQGNGNGNGGGNNNDDSEFIRVQESYDLLIDPVRRRQYDQHRRVMKVQQEQERRKQEQKRRQQEWLLQQQREKQREKLKKQQEQQKWQQRQDQQRSQRRRQQQNYYQQQQQQQQRTTNSNQNSNSRANQQVKKLIVVNEHNQPINLYRLVQKPFHHFRNQHQYDLQLVHGNIPPGGLQTLRRASNLHLGDVLVARDVRVDGFLDDDKNSKSKRFSDSTILFRYTLSDETNDVDKAKLVIGLHYHHRQEATKIMMDGAAADSVYTSDCYDLSSKCLEMNDSPSLNCETFPEFMTHMCRLTCKKCHRPPPISSRRGKNTHDSYRRRSQFHQYTNEEDELSFSSLYSILSNFMATFRHVDAWYDILVWVDDATEFILAGCRSFPEKLDELLSYREYALLAWVMLSFITGLYSVLLFNIWNAAVSAFIPWMLFTLVGTEQVQDILYSPSFLDGFLEDTMHIVQYNFNAATCFLFLFYAVGVVITMTIDRLTDLHEAGNNPSNNSSKCTHQIQQDKTRRTIDSSPPIVQSSSSSSSSSSATSPEKTSALEVTSFQQNDHALKGVPVHLKQE